MTKPVAQISVVRFLHAEIRTRAVVRHARNAEIDTSVLGDAKHEIRRPHSFGPVGRKAVARFRTDKGNVEQRIAAADVGIGGKRNGYRFAVQFHQAHRCGRRVIRLISARSFSDFEFAVFVEPRIIADHEIIPVEQKIFAEIGQADRKRKFEFVRSIARSVRQRIYGFICTGNQAYRLNIGGRQAARYRFFAVRGVNRDQRIGRRVEPVALDRRHFRKGKIFARAALQPLRLVERGKLPFFHKRHRGFFGIDGRLKIKLFFDFHARVVAYVIHDLIVQKIISRRRELLRHVGRPRIDHIVLIAAVLIQPRNGHFTIGADILTVAVCRRRCGQ